MTRDEFRAKMEGTDSSCDMLYVPEYLIDIHGHTSRAPETVPSSQSGFTFGPMKIPEPNANEASKPSSSTNKPKRMKMDVVSMLASTSS